MMNSPTVRQMTKIWNARARMSQREGGEEEAGRGEFIGSSTEAMVSIRSSHYSTNDPLSIASIPRSLPGVTGVCSCAVWENFQRDFI
ncbi:MAG TPA: hypothetical protein VN843_04010 [Anaerolineales bacterium]|nr:hypothetical protein [Anaerolineales bacterium]